MRDTVYTDGACSRRKGGWAWWVDDHLWDAGAVPDSTNNQMELLAVIKALEALPRSTLLIVSDSAYVVNCFADQWHLNWRRNGWVSTSGKPVANRDLWERLLALYEDHRQPITFRHCRGHGKGGIGDAPHVFGNAQADRLAVQARMTLER